MKQKEITVFAVILSLDDECEQGDHNQKDMTKKGAERICFISFLFVHEKMKSIFVDFVLFFFF
jgi:hypothetical protein